MIHRLHRGPERHGMDELCEAFGVSRGGYYAHPRKPEGARRREDGELRPKVARAFRGGA